MEIYVTRDDVHAGDDPEARTFSFPDGTSIKEIIEYIVASQFLAQISGGKATWSVVSGFPLAVVAQQWTEAHLVPWRPIEMAQLIRENGVVHLHFNYHTQIDPDIVLRILKDLKLYLR